MPVILVQEIIMVTLGFYVGWKANQKKSEISNKVSSMFNGKG